MRRLRWWYLCIAYAMQCTLSSAREVLCHLGRHRDARDREWAVRFNVAFARSYARLNSPLPVRCTECGWVGRLIDVYYSYVRDGMCHVEPALFCPECGGTINA